MSTKGRKLTVATFVLLFLLTACNQPVDTGSSNTQIMLAAYTVPKEAYQKEIIPAFQKQWKEKTGQTVTFKESYVGSGAQARAIVNGLEADVAALSLEGDIETIHKAGLITHDWKQRPHNGMITRSVVAFGVKKGNPLTIREWQDLTKPGIAVLYPSPRTSGGAMWDINAIYGAGLKMAEMETGKKDPDRGRELLSAIQKNVKVMDNSGRESMTTFEKGLGDVVVTYENELLLRNMEQPLYDVIYPKATILIENPVALVDKNVDKHGNRAVVEAFVAYLQSTEAQRAFAKYGFRPVDPTVMAETKDKFPEPEWLFDIDYLGGWATASEQIYGPQGVWTGIVEGKKGS
ncbi:sulfate abc transporter, sulfate-binding protein, putative [Heliomicrobium modesticaldum Ice1]|uniref:Sulfate abc transporter, sulfate-binding protein, putative n=1 Tax=Heliobacterium modesticaldum (strain ATCC 51547 / Ice1) TaxID=498761 RepID=B0THG6_HELMI|nr:sulfate ABC transporter substrate-binding protein [Heliomicrobium modesticaldum]ABZ83404.1 sulfate abc transporter, sulfate-binding protein, putative [Heliomicrobium modesticaldum Ice1]